MAISYDPADSLTKFAKGRKITFPLLSDSKSEAIKAFGILNEKAPGFAKGVPHPGTFIVNKKGIVQAKLFHEGYRKRHTAEEIMKSVKESTKP